MENLNLIRDLAHSFAEKTNLDYKDLFSEAAYQYCQAIQRFDKDNGAKFTTFATCHIKNLLINYCKKETAYRNRCIGQADWPEGYEPVAPEASPDFEALISQWPEDAQQIARMILDQPEMYMGETPNFRRNYVGQKRRLKKVKEDLYQNFWWGRDRIDRAVEQVQSQLQAM